MGVRFLSVNDLLDSNDEQSSSVGLEAGFKTLIYDLYSKDLSAKVKTGQVARVKKVSI